MSFPNKRIQFVYNSIKSSIGIQRIGYLFSRIHIWHYNLSIFLKRRETFFGLGFFTDKSGSGVAGKNGFSFSPKRF